MTTSRIERLRALHAAATPGPWWWEGRKVDEDGYVYVPQGSTFGPTQIHLGDSYENSDRDCDLIAESRNLTPDMLEL